MTTFDGNGNLTQTDNIHGSISGYTAPDRQGTGTYSLKPRLQRHHASEQSRLAHADSSDRSRR